MMLLSCVCGAVFSVVCEERRQKTVFMTTKENIFFLNIEKNPPMTVIMMRLT